MKQRAFEAQGSERWREFAELLGRLDARDRKAAPEFPPRYRRICQDLALARDRRFSQELVERLNQLALRGHEHLYRVHNPRLHQVTDFITRDFPRAVRGEWALLVLTSLLFYGSAWGLVWLLAWQPELVYSFLDPDSVASIEQMYGPDAERVGVARDASGDVWMFGFYIWNNVSIAFRTFAAGLLFGVGTLLIVIANSIHLGVVAGHLLNVDSATRLFTFVIAHGAFELTAILLAGVAGMRLGLALLAPGAKSRRQALRDGARNALPIVYGAGLMLLVAAGLHAAVGRVAGARFFGRRRRRIRNSTRREGGEPGSDQLAALRVRPGSEPVTARRSSVGLIGVPSQGHRRRTNPWPSGCRRTS